MTKRNLSVRLEKYQSRVDEALADLKNYMVIDRTWNHYYTVWKPYPTEISNRLGWLHIAEVMKENLCYMKAVTDSIRADGYTDVLLLGMGGSSLAPEVFSKTFGKNDGFLKLNILDSTDPGTVADREQDLDLSRCLFIVSTKSGGTVETLSFFKYFYNKVADSVGSDKAGEHFIAITDPGSKLESMAEDYKFRETFLNDSTIGGRYSVLSYFGLVPAMLLGIDVGKLLDRATDMMNECQESEDLEDNPSAYLGAIMGGLVAAKRDKLTLVISPPIASFGAWIEQLIAESTGKDGTGILPVDGEDLGSRDIYKDDRLFVYLRLHGDSTHDNAVDALRNTKFPVVQIDLENKYDLGGEFFRWEMATAIAGYHLGINPFDQPDVESAKIRAREMVDTYMQDGTLPLPTSSFDEKDITVYDNTGEKSIKEVLDSFINQAECDSYISIQAYIQPTQKADEALQKFRIKLRNKFKLGTTSGYGPRFLHSTGQLHKGDSNKGLFIQITADDQLDLDIPDDAGKPDSSMTFGILKSAQALGDGQALSDAKRRMIRFHLNDDIAEGLDYLTEKISS